MTAITWSSPRADGRLLTPISDIWAGFQSNLDARPLRRLALL